MATTYRYLFAKLAELGLSHEEAKAWAEAVIAERNDKTAGSPGTNPSLPIIPYDPANDVVLVREKLKQKALDAGLTEEEIRVLKLLA